MQRLSAIKKVAPCEFVITYALSFQQVEPLACDDLAVVMGHAQQAMLCQAGYDFQAMSPSYLRQGRWRSDG